ncbi:leucine-rich repeat and guanylate kinase domain-containing protein [Suncus etruscus]|uniref:leucine-rich repeat and guanylate kinase domain-containing protein n=1 Tax=Suncus etruscus TaxID=109475 RepID=UPI00210FF1CF|nr:leucine-rich repeat and guanylate kinase domain-containing protein [Suncus etruscus]
MRPRLKSDFHVTSSYLLHQIVQRCQDLEAEEESKEEEEVEGEDHLESEESSESEMQELEEEFDGVLREEAIANALHQLGRSGSGTEQVYLNLTLLDCDLIDVSILSGYVHLQKLDLSVNKIKDLSCVSFMPYLLELNASRNKLTTFFNFYPPKNLQKVDFSFNQISAMSDLSAYQALTKLILDSNEIEEIVGLQNCNSLTHLSLSKNKITTISGLDALPIRTLYLSCNKIEKITGLDELRTLQILDLSHNQISSLQGLENHEFLEMINLEDNKIAELGEIEYIEHLPLLRVLNFLKNPIQEKTDYWFFIIFMLPRLIELDQKKINVEDKVAAVNKYDPPPELVAAQDHLTHVANSVMQPQRIFDSTLPSLDAPYPMLILVGPAACGKRELAHRLCRQYSRYFRYGACHTTRPPYFGEGDRVDYHFVSQEDFDEMRNMGKFILTFNYGNHNYGLNRDTVEGIARDGLASCIHMEIEGVRSLKCSYFEPRYILVVPMNKTKYEGYLRRKGLFSRIEIEFAVSRVDLYIQINQTLPGYFDAVINADDLDIAYQNLSQLIREYLGLSDHSAMTLAPPAGVPSNKKTPSGVPAHLVPSPRRLARLQADGPPPDQLPGTQLEVQIPTSLQDQEGAAPNSPKETESPPQPSTSAPGAPQLTQDLANQPPSDLPANEAGQLSKQLGPPRVQSPQPNQDEESGETTGPPAAPAGINPQESQDEEAKSTNLPPPNSQDGPPSLEDSQQPVGEETPKQGAVRAGTPYPDLPHSQDATNTHRPPGKGEVAAPISTSRLAPTRLPQPRVLAPLQSPRPTPKLLSPSRPDDTLGTSSDQTLTPSPRPLLAPEGDPSKLPPITSPHSRPLPNRSPHPGPSPHQLQEEPAREVKLPLISPPGPEQAPNPPPEEGPRGVKLPRLPTPYTEQPGPRSSQTRPVKERQAPKAGQSSSRRIPDVHASPQSQEPRKLAGARKKKLPLQQEMAKVSPGNTPRSRQAAAAWPPVSQSKQTRSRGSEHPHPSPSGNPQRNHSRKARSLKIPAPTQDEPLSQNTQVQEDKREMGRSPRKGGQTPMAPHRPVQRAAASKKGASLKSEQPGGMIQRKKATPGSHPSSVRPPQSGKASAEARPKGSAPEEPVKKKEKGADLPRKGRSQKRETVSEPPEPGGEPPMQPLDRDKPQAPQDSKEDSLPRDSTSVQPAKEKRPGKQSEAPQDPSPTTPQNQGPVEEQSKRKGRVRARGSQSTKI